MISQCSLFGQRKRTKLSMAASRSTKICLKRNENQPSMKNWHISNLRDAYEVGTDDYIVEREIGNVKICLLKVPLIVTYLEMFFVMFVISKVMSC